MLWVVGMEWKKITFKINIYGISKIIIYYLFCVTFTAWHGMAGCKIPTANTQNKTNEILGTSLVEMGHRNQSCKTDFYVTRMAGFVPFRMEDAFWSLQL